MSKAFKNLLFFLAFIVVFCAADSVLQAAQVDEGWRWKKNLNIYITTVAPAGDGAAAGGGGGAAAPTYGPVPVQQIHEEMARHETRLTYYLPAADHDPNIAVASITLVLQMGEAENQGLYRTTDWLRPVPMAAVGPVVDAAPVAADELERRAHRREREEGEGLEGERAAVRQRREGEELAGGEAPRGAAVARVEEVHPPREEMRYYFPSTAAINLRAVANEWDKPNAVNTPSPTLWRHLFFFICEIKRS